MLCKVYDEIYDDIKGKLAAIDYLAVTSDGWTANYQKKCYLSLTAHYIDDNFEFKTYKLGAFIKLINMIIYLLQKNLKIN